MQQRSVGWRSKLATNMYKSNQGVHPSLHCGIAAFTQRLIKVQLPPVWFYSTPTWHTVDHFQIQASVFCVSFLKITNSNDRILLLFTTVAKSIRVGPNVRAFFENSKTANHQTRFLCSKVVISDKIASHMAADQQVSCLLSVCKPGGNIVITYLPNCSFTLMYAQKLSEPSPDSTVLPETELLSEGVEIDSGQEGNWLLLIIYKSLPA